MKMRNDVLVFCLISMYLLFSQTLFAQKKIFVRVWSDSTMTNLCCIYESIYNDRTGRISQNDTLNKVTDCRHYMGLLNGYFVDFEQCSTDTSSIILYERGNPVSGKSFVNGSVVSEWLPLFNNDNSKIGRKSIKYFENGNKKSIENDTIVYSDSMTFLGHKGEVVSYYLQGIQYYYFDNHNIKKIENYHLGKRVGAYYEYNKDGTLKVYGYYKNNQRYGRWYYFDEKRKVKIKKY